MAADARAASIEALARLGDRETVGCAPEALWITRAPSLAAKKALLFKVERRARRALHCYAAAEKLGGDRISLIERLPRGEADFAAAYAYPALNWADLAALAWLIDGATALEAAARSDRACDAHARAAARIADEARADRRRGFEAMATLCAGTPAQKTMAQDALNRWWWPALMSFGPPDAIAAQDPRAFASDLEPPTNDALRQAFVDQTIPEAAELGLDAPDPDLDWDEARAMHDFGEPDWEEYFRVRNGEGPCCRERSAARRRAFEDGAWFRDALRASADLRETATASAG